jgi:hypothetical protein
MKSDYNVLCTYYLIQPLTSKAHILTMSLFAIFRRLPLGSDPALLKRLFREINMGRSVDLNSISFAHWSTGMVRICLNGAIVGGVRGSI